MTAQTFARPVSAPVRAPLRLTRRGRRLVLTLTVIALSVLLLVVFSLGRVSSQAATPTRTPGPGAAAPVLRTVVVAPGETLWDIAVRVAPGVDPRDTVARLQEANQLSGSDLVVGQQLVLPNG